MLVLGIDPGFGRLGWSLVDGNRSKQILIDCGCVETSSKLSSTARLIQIHQEIAKLIEQYHPTVAAVEDLFFFKNAKTVIGVAEARGMIIAECALLNLEVYDYTPLQVKQTITGYGRAEKSQVETMVKQILKLKETIKPDDAADAVAIALTHLLTNRTLLIK